MFWFYPHPQPFLACHRLKTSIVTKQVAVKTSILSSTRKVRIGLEYAQSPIHWELSLYYLTNKLCGKALFMQIIIWHDSAFTRWEKPYPWELLFKILNNSWLIWQLTEERRSIVNSLRHEMCFRPAQHNEKKDMIKYFLWLASHMFWTYVEVPAPSTYDSAFIWD